MKRAFTPAEDALIRAHWPNVRALNNLLDRASSSLYNRAARLGLHEPRRPALTNQRHWVGGHLLAGSPHEGHGRPARPRRNTRTHARPVRAPQGRDPERSNTMSQHVRFLFETVVEARREWVEAQGHLNDAQRKNFVYGLELVRAMEAEGITTVTYDGVTLHLTDDEERWENNPLDDLEDDD